ncbi:MAG: hypothetical protein AAF750_14225 [Planctomycetota bacterium]
MAALQTFISSRTGATITMGVVSAVIFGIATVIYFVVPRTKRIVAANILMIAGLTMALTVLLIPIGLVAKNAPIAPLLGVALFTGIPMAFIGVALRRVIAWKDAE